MPSKLDASHHVLYGAKANHHHEARKEARHERQAVRQEARHDRQEARQRAHQGTDDEGGSHTGQLVGTSPDTYTPRPDDETMSTHPDDEAPPQSCKSNKLKKFLTAHNLCVNIESATSCENLKPGSDMDMCKKFQKMNCAWDDVVNACQI